MPSIGCDVITMAGKYEQLWTIVNVECEKENTISVYLLCKMYLTAGARNNYFTESLKVLSFNSVRVNFSRHWLCYKSTEDGIRTKNLHFLQREYAPQLLYELHENRQLEKKYFDFLVNEYLTELEVKPLLIHLEEEEILEKVVPIAHNLQEISSSHGFSFALDSSAVSVLEKLFPHFCNVRKVMVATICNDKLLECIVSSCPNLIELDIEFSDITGKGIKALYTNSDGLIQTKSPIKYLNLKCCLDLHSNDVAFLIKSLPTLKEVVYHDWPSVIESLHLLNLNNNNQDVITWNLLSLDLPDLESPSELSQLLTFSAEICPYIKALNTSILNVRDLNLISNFSCLQDLTLSYSFYGAVENVININDFLISVGKRLRNLSLTDFALSVSVLADSCPNLERVSLGKIHFQNLEEDYVKPFKLLQSLMFKPRHSLIEKISIVKFLYACPKLESLTFFDFNIDTVDGEEFLNFFLDSKLRDLEFQNSNVELDFFRKLIMNCSSLRKLYIWGCRNVCKDEHDMLYQLINESSRKIEINVYDFSWPWEFILQQGII